MEPLDKCRYCGKQLKDPKVKTCPHCHMRLTPSIFQRKGLLLFIVLLICIPGSLAFFYVTEPGVARELRQVRQPRPNRFSVAVDVSATIDQSTLDMVKVGLSERLQKFIGQQAVSYEIYTFGKPGCGKNAVSEVVATESPSDKQAFQVDVKLAIDKRIQLSELSLTSPLPLTTPLYYLLGQRLLPKNPGGRIIIFSDLMNDDSDCPQQYTFPEEALIEFGKNPQGQLIFVYPTPPLTNTPELNQEILERQQDFIDRVQSLSRAGKLRAFFYHLPDDPEDRPDFIQAQLRNAIPATTFEIVWERASRVVDTIVSAVRG